MTIERKQYKIDICGEQYTLVSDENQEHVLQSAYYVDSLMKEIVTKTSVTMVDTKKVAVLVALQIASEVMHLKRSIKQDKEKEAHLVDRIERILGLLSVS